MKRESLRIAGIIVALGVCAGLTPEWLGSEARSLANKEVSQATAPAGVGSVAGIVKDAAGKPFPDMTIVLEPSSGAIPIEITTDAEGKFKKAGVPEGTYIVVYKDKDVVVLKRQARVAANRETKADLNMADPEIAAYIAKTKKDNEEIAKLGKLKGHFNAGVESLTKAQALRDQMSKAPLDQKAGLQAQIEPLTAAAIDEFHQALAAVDATDVTNHVVVLNNIGAANEASGRYADAAKAYQESVALKPDAGSYNNLGNDLAKSGKMAEAKEAYEKSAELDPKDAAKAYRNFGAVMYNAGALKDSPAVDLLKKATQLEPTNVQGWYLLGIALAANMGVKQEGDKINFIVLPGTVEAFQKCIELDPKGPLADQSRAQLEELKGYGVGIQTKVTTPKVKH